MVATDVHKEREASVLRLFDVWGGLAKRYSRRMDDDDLVDITTGEIVLDNGVLRNAPILEFGSLAAPVDATHEDEANDDETDGEEDESGLDELDAFADTTTFDTEEAKSEPGPLPPTSFLNQAYTDDLHEFLEAEKSRKEECGTDVEESDEEQSVGEDVLEDDSDDSRRSTERYRDDTEPIVVTSDDELNFWMADDFPAVHRVRNDIVDGKRTSFGRRKKTRQSLKRKRDSSSSDDTPELTTEGTGSKRDTPNGSPTSRAFLPPRHRSRVPNMSNPLPDPRAQLIIAQAVQQLSALVTGTWQSPDHYPEESLLRTPRRRSMNFYDADFSRASLPPESPEEKHYATPLRRSLVPVRRRRARKVSFLLDDEENDIQAVSPEAYGTPTTKRTSITEVGTVHSPRRKRSLDLNSSNP